MSAHSPVQVQSVTTDASGNATWTFTPPFHAPPKITIGAGNAAEQPIVVSVTAVSSTSVTIHADRARRLPGGLLFLTQLNDFNIFGGDASGVTIHLMAEEP